MRALRGEFLRVASMILGIIGGIAGFGGALCAIRWCSRCFIFSIRYEFYNWSRCYGYIFSLLGLVGGALALKKPKVAGIMMLISAIGGLFRFRGAML